MQAAGPPVDPGDPHRGGSGGRARTGPRTGFVDKLMFWRKPPQPGIVVDPAEGGAAPARERGARPEPGDRRHADRAAEAAGAAGRDLLAIEPDRGRPAFRPGRRRTGVRRRRQQRSALPTAAHSVLIQGYLPAQLPGDPHPVLPLRRGHASRPACRRARSCARTAIAIAANATPMVTPSAIGPRTRARLPGRDDARLCPDPPARAARPSRCCCRARLAGGDRRRTTTG